MKKTALTIVATMGLASGFAVAQKSQPMQVLTPAQSIEQPATTEGDAALDAQRGAAIQEERMTTQTTPSDESAASDEAGQEMQEDSTQNAE